MKNRKTRSAMRRMLFTLALVLVVAVASVGGTIAWLKVSTEPVVNTFTVGDINITLTETATTTVDGKQTKQFKIIPGVDIDKDPKVTVKANSEACWLFVKVEEDNWPTVTETIGDLETTGTTTVRKVNYEIVRDWQKLTGVAGVDNVYYRKVNATTADAVFNVLKDNKVTVSQNLTKTDVATIKNAGTPTLTFTAYAVQQDGIADNPATAWAQASTATTTGN